MIIQRKSIGVREAAPVKAFVGITDSDWYSFLAARPNIDEVNFWQPSGAKQFRAVAPGELFLFKLHAPRPLCRVAGGRAESWQQVLGEMEREPI